MNILPTVNATLKCKLSKEEVIHRMKNEAQSKKIDGINIAEIYWGELGDNIYEIVNRIDFRNGGVKTCTFSSEQESTKINIRFKFGSRFLYFFSSIWILGNIALFAGWFGFPVYFDNKFLVALFIFGFPFLFYLKDLITFYRVKKVTIYHIKSLLGGETVN